MQVQPSGTVTLVFTDIEGSTRLLSELGRERYLEALTEHRQRVRDAFARFDGYEVDYEGDSFFYAFQSATAAASAVREGMTALRDGPIRVRVGIHTGEPGLDPPKYVGIDVHRAARIMACAHGGQAVLSQATRELLEDADGLRDLGEHRLKDLSAPVRLYQLGDGEFPPLRSLYRTNLPFPATPFLGREQELAEVASLLEREDVRLLTLTGPGGTGKTRLALQAAAESADRHPHGIWWVPLAPLRTPALLPHAVAQALEIKEQPGRAISETLTDRLVGKRLLLLLDNAEHLLPEAATAISTLIEIGGPQVLVTSRERLQLGGEHLYPVPVLAELDATSLFTARARQLDPAFAAPPELATLCARLDNLPLALELAAARTSLFSVEQLIDRLAQRLDLLKGGRDADARQRTLRATIDWSYQLLDDEEQRVFRAVSVFVGGCTFEAIEAVSECDLDTLQSLLDKSLLRRRDGVLGSRYWMLETVREFAGDAVEVDEADRIHSRHAAHFLSVAEEAESGARGADLPRYLQLMTGEQENIRAALSWFAVQGNDEELARLVNALYDYWFTRGPVSEGREWTQLAVERSSQLALTLQTTVLRHLAFFAYLEGDVAFGRTHAEHALEIVEAGGADSDLQISVMNNVATLRAANGDVDNARALYREALVFARDAATTPRLIADVSHNLGEHELVAGNVDAARERFTESLALYDDAGDTMTWAVSLAMLAACDLMDGDDPRCSERLRRALLAFTDLGYASGVRLCFHVLAGLEASREHRIAAARLLGAAYRLEQESGLPPEDVERFLREQAERVLASNEPDCSVGDARRDGMAMTSERAIGLALELLE
jgi:predicted ATPase/class 3 adenylate cyclase